MATAPVVGRCAPVINLNSVVFPIPFRPTMPHRSPSAMVKVMSLNSVFAPKSTDAFETDISVNYGSGLNVVTARNVTEVPPYPPSARGPDAPFGALLRRCDPGLPIRFCETKRDLLSKADKRLHEEQRFISQLGEPTVVVHACVLQSKIVVTR